MGYFSMHNHTHYSNLTLIDSINKESDLIDYAEEIGLSGIAITDHESLSGHIKALNYHKKNNKTIKLALGNEIYIGREGLNAENHVKGEPFFHVVLIAKDAIGHEQLRKLSTRAWERSYMKNIMRRPTYMSDLVDIVMSNPGHLIATTACLGGVTGKEFLTFKKILKTEDKEYDKGFQALQFLFDAKSIFKDDFYIEIQPSDNSDQIKYNKYMIDNFYDDFNFIYATDSHYCSKKDYSIFKTFLNSKSSKEREVDEFYASAHMMSKEEVWDYFKKYITIEQFNKMTENSLKALDEIEHYELGNKDTIIPKVPIDQGLIDNVFDNISFDLNKYPNIKFFTENTKDDQFYVAQILNGFNNLVTDSFEIYLERIDLELKHIKSISENINQPMSAYFNTMTKIIDLIWDIGDSLVGVGRGSAAAFLTNYLLGITQVDTIKSQVRLPYWRFLHQDRPDFPDIDIDTEGSKRLQIMNRIREYFHSIGGDLVQVATFGTEGAKGALKTAARGLKIPEEKISYLVSLIPNERGADWSLSDCLFGNEEEHRTPRKNFINEIKTMPKLEAVALKIEGLITRSGIHAAGVVVLNSKITDFTSAMKTNSGSLITAYDLKDCESAGMIKYDFLTSNALDKIRTTINFLLEDELIEWKGNLRDTYMSILSPNKLEYTNQEMWKKVQNGEIVSLFQFDTPVGGQAIRQLKPENFIQLAAANSLMRLQPTDDGIIPMKVYEQQRNNINTWYAKMKEYELTEEEISVLEKILLEYYGVADTQELVMDFVMHPQIANGDIIMANKLRKGLAKKIPEVIEEAKKRFYDSGRQAGTSLNMLNYIWKEQITLSLGYSFSIVHTAVYTTIAIQEMQLATKYPIIYWNTANLCNDSGAFNDFDFPNLRAKGIIKHIDDKDKRKVNKVQYGKIALAVANMKEAKIELPEINKSGYGFKPNKEDHSVLFGLQAISKISEQVINSIIEKRPFSSVQDFVSKMVDEQGKKLISKDRVINLIKSGAFDKIENKDRISIMKDFISVISEPKKALTLSNTKMLADRELFSDKIANNLRYYNFNKYLMKIREHKDVDYIELDEIATSFIEEEGLNNVVKEPNTLVVSEWKKIYNENANVIRAEIKERYNVLLEELNKKLYEETWDKYASGGILTWELESLHFLYSGHPLQELVPKLPVEITHIDELEDSPIVGYFNIKGKQIPKYHLSHLAGVVIDKDKAKHIVYLATYPYGVMSIKLYRDEFAKYDKKNIDTDEEGNKILLDDSWFEKGTALIVTGIKKGETFVPKVYKQTKMKPIIKVQKTGELWEFVKSKNND